MVIAIDMDNTLCNFTAGAIQYALFEGVNLANIRKKFTTFDIFSILYPNNSVYMADKIMSTPGFWLDLKPYPYAKSALLYLKNKATLAVVTKPWNNYNCFPEKMAWLRHHFGGIIDPANVVFTWNKDLIPADYIIEDKIDNYKNLDGRKIIIYDQEYNQKDHGTVRVHSWREIEGYFRNENI